MSGFDKGRSFFNSLIITPLMKLVRLHQIGNLLSIRYGGPLHKIIIKLDIMRCGLALPIIFDEIVRKYDRSVDLLT